MQSSAGFRTISRSLTARSRALCSIVWMPQIASGQLFEWNIANTRRGVICFLLILEKRYHNSAGARMGSDHTSYGRIANFFQVSLPDVTAVFDIF